MGHTSVLPAGKIAAVSSHIISNSLLFVITTVLLVLPSAHSELYVEQNEMHILVDATHLFNMVQIGEYNETLTVTSVIQHSDLVQLVPATFEIPAAANPDPDVVRKHEISAYGKSPGHSEVTFNITPPIYGPNTFDRSLFMRITVMHSQIILVISQIMGWIYFIAWSVSFYPQIYINFKRKSVVGLNFDFLSLNIYGFTMYSLFNCGLYFSQVIQSEYFTRHPRSLNPVQLNDVFFSLHASFATLITIAQCIIYEREDQRVSTVARGILTLFTGVVIVSASLVAADKLEWLDFLYYCSYIKLCITLIKYMPQAYMNYKRKSTVGWSIGNIFLDFVGGVLSILQMMLNAYNYNDWISFFGDFTKFGLGAFSIVFDIFFMLQHYVFYRAGKSLGSDSSDEELSMLTSKSVDGMEYFLVVDEWHARYILLPGANSRASTDNLHEDTETNESTPETPYQGPPEVT